VYGDDASTFVACLSRSIALASCQNANPILQNIVLPLSQSQTACVRLVTRTSNGCGACERLRQLRPSGGQS